MCLLSHRIHSIYVLRLFNDPVAMIFLYAAVNAMLYDSWLLAAILYRLDIIYHMAWFVIFKARLTDLFCMTVLVKMLGFDTCLSFCFIDYGLAWRATRGSVSTLKLLV